MRILFAGDSITEGWVQADPTLFETRGWVGTGRGGDSTRQVRDRLRDDLRTHQPDLVHILAGINDIAGNDGPTTVDAIELRLSDMVELCRISGAIPMIGTLLPCTCIPWPPALPPHAMIEAVSARIRAMARAATDVRCVDYHSVLKGMSIQELTYDGLHPNLQGYTVMSNTLLDNLRNRPPNASPAAARDVL